MTAVKPSFGRMINGNQPIASGLVMAWLLNEGSGSIAYDSSGNGRNGTIGGTHAPTWTTGSFGSALSFPSTKDGSVALASYTLSPPFTVFCAVQLATTGDDQYWFNAVDTGNRRLASDSSSYWTIAGVAQYTGAHTSTNLVYLAYTVSADDTTYTLYVNGGSVIGTVAATTYSAGVYFGNRSTGTAGGYGLGEFVYAWNRVLSSSEIALLNINPFAPYNPSTLMFFKLI